MRVSHASNLSRKRGAVGEGIELETKDLYSRVMEEIRHLYLKVGDWVVHRRYPEWGSGLVVEERNSSVQGGSSYVKVAFRDGQTRIFDNNFKNATCCYHAGLRRC